jgi:type II secretory pathway component GspD/PulD (secretin)
MKSCRILILPILCVSAWAAAAVGQESPQKPPLNKEAVQPKPVAPAGEQVLKIFRLQHLPASDLQFTANELLGESEDGSGKAARFAVDARNNSLIAVADQRTLQSVGALALALDKPPEPPEGPEPRLKTIKLQHADPNDVMTAMQQLSLNGVVASYPDERTRTLFVKGPDDAIARLMTLVQQLDVASPATPRVPNVSLRIVWLVDKSLAGTDSAPVPDDWNSAIENLRKQVKFDELRMATQIVVTFAPVEGAKFESTATAKLKTKSGLHAAGLFAHKEQGGSQLRLQLSAKVEETGEEICNVSTTCSGALQWQPVIVGMTTANSQPCVFVIQFVRD